MHNYARPPLYNYARAYCTTTLGSPALLVRGSICTTPVQDLAVLRRDFGVKGTQRLSLFEVSCPSWPSSGPSSVQGANRCLHLVLGSACMGFPVLVGSWLAVCGFLLALG